MIGDGVMPDTALDDLLRDVAGDLVLHLFTGDHRPGRATTLADLPEATFPGYRAETIGPGLWRVEAGVAVGPEIRYEQTADANVPERVAGWYLATKAGRLRWTARFGPAPASEPQPPYAMFRRLDYLTVLPRVRLSRLVGEA